MFRLVCVVIAIYLLNFEDREVVRNAASAPLTMRALQRTIKYGFGTPILERRKMGDRLTVFQCVCTIPSSLIQSSEA